MKKPFIIIDDEGPTLEQLATFGSFKDVFDKHSKQLKKKGNKKITLITTTVPENLSNKQNKNIWQ